MFKHVVKHTNERARRDLKKRSKILDEWMPFELGEMKGNVDALCLIGVYRCQHASLYLLWSPSPSGRAIVFASFDRNRFEQLLANLGFESCKYRNTSAPFRQMWEQFFENYRKHWAVSAYVTVYEQLRSFLGRL